MEEVDVEDKVCPFTSSFAVLLPTREVYVSYAFSSPQVTQEAIDAAAVANSKFKVACAFISLV